VNRGNRQLPYIIAAVGGGFLFISLFLDWVSGPSLPSGATGSLSLSKTGWELFSGVDIFLALLGIATIAYCVLWLIGIEPWPPLRGFVRWGGLVGLGVVLNFLLDQDNFAVSNDLDVGVFVAVLATAAILVGGILLVRPELVQRLEGAAGGRVREPARGRAEPGAQPVTAARPAAQPAASPSRPAAPQPQAAQPAARYEVPATPAAPGAPTQPAAPARPAAPPAPPPQPPVPPEPPAAHPGPPAGWYPDPQGLARLRYWDGAAWTDQTSA